MLLRDSKTLIVFAIILSVNNEVKKERLCSHSSVAYRPKKADIFTTTQNLGRIGTVVGVRAVNIVVQLHENVVQNYIAIG